MNYKIGIFGSAEGNFQTILKKAHLLGAELGRRKTIVITGATTGLPYEVSLSAYNNGAEIWGFSQASDFASQANLTPNLDNSIFTKLEYVPKNYQFIQNNAVRKKYRNVTSTATCEAGLIISGRWGTLNEFTNLYDFGKVIGVLKGTGGVADELEYLMGKISKPSIAKVFFHSSPKKLLDIIINELENR